MRRSSTGCAAVVLAAALFACKPVDAREATDAGYAALGRSDFSESAEHFERALGAMEPDDGQFVRAQRGMIEALAHALPDRAVVQMEVLAEARPDDVSPAVYLEVVGQLLVAKHGAQAVRVLHRGLERFPGAERLTAKLAEVTAEAERTGDDALLEVLGGLGYLGD